MNTHEPAHRTFTDRPMKREREALPQATLGFFSLCGLVLVGSVVAQVQSPPSAAIWMRLDPLPAEVRLTPRESFDGVPPRFVLMTDGAIFVGGKRELLRGRLDKKEMQEISTGLDVALRSTGKAGPPQTLVVGEGPAIFRLSILLGAPYQVVVTGSLTPPAGTPLSSLPDFIKRLAFFRHPSLRPFEPSEFAMIVREKTLLGGCRTAKDLPSLAQSLSSEIVVPQSLTLGFPTGPDMAQVCEGGRRYTVVFRPLIPGEK